MDILPDSRALHERLRATFVWRGDRTDEHRYADISAWWRDPQLLAALGKELADLFRSENPTVVLAPEAQGVRALLHERDL